MERQNRTLKYDYLQAYRDTSLSGVMTVMIEKFFSRCISQVSVVVQCAAVIAIFTGQRNAVHLMPGLAMAILYVRLSVHRTRDPRQNAIRYHQAVLTTK